MAVLVDVASAIVTELANASLSESYAIARSYADWNDELSDFDDPRIDVVPVTQTSTLISRGKLAYICTVSVLVRKLLVQENDRVAASGRIDVDSVDPLVNDLQTILEYFAPSQPSQNGRRLSDVPDAAWLEDSGIKAPFSRKMIRKSQYSGWVSLVYRVPRAAGS